MGNAALRVNGAAFVEERALGAGGFSRVLQVRRGGERCALKHSRGLSGDELARARLEIRVQRQLQHANCLRLLDAEVRVDAAHTRRSSSGGGHEDEQVWEALLLLPLLRKGSLQALLDQAAAAGRAAFSERECLRFFSLLLDAVQALHALGFAHRDIKPGNVLLSDADPAEPVLMDFGSVAPLSRVVRSFQDARRECEAAARLSSAAYRAPELWEAGDVALQGRGTVDGRADVWSLGCVLYAMAFGPFSPFEDPREGVQQLAVLRGDVRFASPSASEFSPMFVALVRWILTPDAAERPTLDGVRQCVRQLQVIPPAPLRRLSSTVPPMQLVRQLSKQESWADFAAFGAATDGDAAREEDDAQSASPLTSTAAREEEDDDDPLRRRALSKSGRQMLMHALSDTSIA